MLAFEKRWAVDVLEGFAPPDNPGFSPKNVQVDWLGAMRKMMQASTRTAALGLRLALWMVALAPVWLTGRFRTLGHLGPAPRSEILRRLLGHRLYIVRELTLLLKLNACMAMFGLSALRQRSGYDVDPGEEVEESGERPRLRLPVTDAEPDGQEVA